MVAKMGIVALSLILLMKLFYISIVGKMIITLLIHEITTMDIQKGERNMRYFSYKDHS